MNTRAKLIGSIAAVTGIIGFGSLAIANLTTPNRSLSVSVLGASAVPNGRLTPTAERGSNSTLAQNSDGMNHGGMNHDGMMNHKMDVGPADANYDLRFLDSMIPHHQGALVMSQEVLAKSKRPELIKLATGILADQQKEIVQMQLWRKQWYPKAASTPIMWHAEMNHEMAMTPKHKESMMMNMSLGKADTRFDKRFLDAMIPHHQGAVTMGKDSLQKSTRPEMKKFAQSIITSQQAEINLMTQWRQKWYGSK